MVAHYEDQTITSLILESVSNITNDYSTPFANNLYLDKICQSFKGKKVNNITKFEEEISGPTKVEFILEIAKIS